MHFRILEAITNVNPAELARAYLVEEMVSRPNETSNNHGLVAFVPLQAPASLRLLASNVFEEVVSEWSLGGLQ